MRNKRRRRWWPRGLAVSRPARYSPARSDLYQLDVKLDSRKSVRVRKSRRNATLVRFAAVALSLLSLSAGARWVYRQMFYENAEFRLNRLQVETDGSLTESEIVEAARVESGGNLMEIELARVRERLEALPMVLGAEVTRELPDLLRIEVRERVPVAWLSCPPHGVKPKSTARGFLVDDNGQIFRCHKLLPRLMHLPTIEVYHMPKPADGTVVESQPVRDAIRLLRESNRLFERDGLLVEQVTLRKSYSLSVDYTNGMEVIFGIRDFERGLQDLRWIVSHAHSSGRELASVNVIPSKNIPIKFHAEPALRAVPITDPELLAPDLPRVGILGPPGPDISPENGLNHELKSILGGG
ncbi:MAG: FtsQ-type POTRA domain-containing protein [Verrucomicrobiae bacterium]|nr:FtsQ-type POTRA domain-containing protein [Verrucomicrobiae bacterium]